MQSYKPPTLGSSPFIPFSLIFFALFLIYLCLLPSLSLAQIHKKPSCQSNIPTSLVWANGVQEFTYLPDGTLNYSVFIDGYTLSYTISGNVQSLTAESPLVVDALASKDALSLYTNGLGKRPIVLTIDISPPIEGDVGLTLFNINQIGNKRKAGDQLIISASLEGGSPIYPKFSTPPMADYTTNEELGILDANASNFSRSQMAGVNWEGEIIDQIQLVWKDCSNCDKEFHSVAIGNLEFCTFVNAGTFDEVVDNIFTDKEKIRVFHYNDHNDCESHLQTYALTDLYGNILEINNVPVFSKQPIGFYHVYAINYQMNGIFSNYTKGENIAILEGPYYHMVETAIEVIPYTPNKSEEESEMDFKMITVEKSNR